MVRTNQLVSRQIVSRKSNIWGLNADATVGLVVAHESHRPTVAAGVYSAARGVWVAPGPLEGQPPGMGGDQLMDRFRPPRPGGIKSNRRRCFEQRDRHFPK